MFRRPNNADRTAVDITTILYSGRSIDVASRGDSDSSAPEQQATKSLALSYSGTKPAVRRGQLGARRDAVGRERQPAPQGYFYRVVNVDDSTPGAGARTANAALGGPLEPSDRSL